MLSLNYALDPRIYLALELWTEWNWRNAEQLVTLKVDLVLWRRPEFKKVNFQVTEVYLLDLLRLHLRNRAFQFGNFFGLLTLHLTETLGLQLCFLL